MPTKPGSWASMVAWIGFKAEQRLREDLLRRKAAQNLVDVADLHLAGGRGLRGSAVLDLAALGLGGARFARGRRPLRRAGPVQAASGEAGQTPPVKAQRPGDLLGNLAACVKGGVSISSRYC